MNDFTKEELQLILEDFDNGKYPLIGDKLKFRDKLQSMIDNYCEHDWENHDYCSKCEKMPYECQACGEIE